MANPQSTGDISIGSLDRDPTGRVISRNLSLPIDPSTNKPIDGYVLTVDSSDTIFGAGWRAPSLRCLAIQTKWLALTPQVN